MSTQALLLMLIVQLSVTAVMVYLFYKVLHKNKK